MSKTPDVSEFAASVLHLIQRFTGNRPDALVQMRAQVQNELDSAREIAARAEAQLAALDQLEALIGGEEDEQLTFPPSSKPPPLKTAILTVLDEDSLRQWHRDELFAELVRRGWGPGGQNPRNTFTARLRDLELETPPRVRRIGRHDFQSAQGGETD